MSLSLLDIIMMSAARTGTGENKLMWVSFGESKQLKHNYYGCFMMSDRVR